MYSHGTALNTRDCFQLSYLTTCVLVKCPFTMTAGWPFHTHTSYPNSYRFLGSKIIQSCWLVRIHSPIHTAWLHEILKRWRTWKLKIIIMQNSLFIPASPPYFYLDNMPSWHKAPFSLSFLSRFWGRESPATCVKGGPAGGRQWQVEVARGHLQGAAEGARTVRKKSSCFLGGKAYIVKEHCLCFLIQFQQMCR